MEASPRFATTQWTLVRQAQSGDPVGQTALELLCRRTWYPLYAFARRRGTPAAAAEDQVQSFFESLLGGSGLAGVKPERGRFRTWLLAAFSHHLQKEREAADARKRGGGRTVIALDVAMAEQRLAYGPAEPETPERAFDRAYALNLVLEAKAELREECEREGKLALYDSVGLETGRRESAGDLASRAQSMGLSEGALRVAAFRLRQRFGDILRRRVAETLDDQSELAEELASLLQALRARD